MGFGSGLGLTSCTSMSARRRTVWPTSCTGLRVRVRAGVGFRVGARVRVGVRVGVRARVRVRVGVRLRLRVGQGVGVGLHGEEERGQQQPPPAQAACHLHRERVPEDVGGRRHLLRLRVGARARARVGRRRWAASPG